MYSKSSQFDSISEALSKKLSNLEILTTILAIISIFLLITLLLFSRIITFNPTGPLLPSEQNPYAFASLYRMNDSQSNLNEKIGKMSIFPDANSGSSPSAFIKGYVNGLKPGTSHGVLILENTNFLLVSDENDNQLFHFNPMGALTHNCKRDSNLNNNVEGHMGDLGDIIANDLGQANVDKYVNGFNVNLIYGRAIVVLKREDPCDAESFYLQKSEILAFGILGIYSEDKEEIELKRQMIEKKKKNMFKFQEKNKENLAEEMKFQNKGTEAEEKNLVKNEQKKPLVFEENKSLLEINNDSVKNEKPSVKTDFVEKKDHILNEQGSETSIHQEPRTKKYEKRERELFSEKDWEEKPILKSKNEQNLKINNDLQSAINAIETNEAETAQPKKEFNEVAITPSEKKINIFEENFGKEKKEAVQPEKSDENLNLNSLFSMEENSNGIFKNLFNLDLHSDPIKSETSENFNEEIKPKTLPISMQPKNLAEKKLPNSYEAELIKKRKSLFKKHNFNFNPNSFQNATTEASLIQERNLTDEENPSYSEISSNSLANQTNISSIFERLTTLIDSTQEKAQQNQQKILENKGEVFVGIDLAHGSQAKNEMKQSNKELKKFQKNFEEGVENDLQQKLKKLEDKI